MSDVSLDPRNPGCWALAARTYERDADQDRIDGGQWPVDPRYSYADVVLYCHLMHAATSAGGLAEGSAL